ncbi:hypothetical protein BH09BAC5_BH09BAC5_17820 [soil metagenome]
MAEDKNLSAIQQEIIWLNSVIQFRMNELQEDSSSESFPEMPVLDSSSYSDFITKNQLNREERIVLILSLTPHFSPEILDPLIYRNPKTNQPFTEVGGIKGKTHSGLLPTIQTALFLLGGTKITERFKYRSIFSFTHFFSKKQIIYFDKKDNSEPSESAALSIYEQYPEYFLSGKIGAPRFNSDFPAKRSTTNLEWDDLVLSPQTKRQIEEIKIWIRTYERMMNELRMDKRLKPGNKILFYGPPGTGKTLTAQLLGKYIEKDVYRIDLSMVVNKYVGETEKNLAKIFDKAENSDWILFFDEADALFGSRTKVSSSHDRYANQEVSYLLQRIEDFNGIVILASNMKGNIDDAFMRRFNNVVHFPFPKADERQQLWKNAFSDKITFTDEVDLRKIAEKFEMSGGHIMNVVAWCSMMALEKNDYKISESMLREGMVRELAKEGRTL